MIIAKSAIRVLIATIFSLHQGLVANQKRRHVYRQMTLVCPIPLYRTLSPALSEIQCHNYCTSALDMS